MNQQWPPVIAAEKLIPPSGSTFAETGVPGMFVGADPTGRYIGPFGVYDYEMSIDKSGVITATPKNPNSGFIPASGTDWGTVMNSLDASLPTPSQLAIYHQPGSYPATVSFRPSAKKGYRFLGNLRSNADVTNTALITYLQSTGWLIDCSANYATGMPPPLSQWIALENMFLYAPDTTGGILNAASCNGLKVEGCQLLGNLISGSIGIKFPTRGHNNMHVIRDTQMFKFARFIDDVDDSLMITNLDTGYYADMGIHFSSTPIHLGIQNFHNTNKGVTSAHELIYDERTPVASTNPIWSQVMLNMLNIDNESNNNALYKNVNGAYYRLLGEQSGGAGSSYQPFGGIFTNLPSVGWAATTPAVPAGTGSGNAVANPNPYSVVVYQSGGVGTHIIDVFGIDSATGTDALVVLPPVCKIYYATTKPSAWAFFGLNA